jgi:hypothetical protein
MKKLSSFFHPIPSNTISSIFKSLPFISAPLIFKLPVDMLVEIALYLTKNDYYSLMRTCTYIYKSIDNDKYWRRRYLKLIDEGWTLINSKNDDSNSSDYWKKLCISLYPPIGEYSKLSHYVSIDFDKKTVHYYNRTICTAINNDLLITDYNCIRVYSPSGKFIKNFAYDMNIVGIMCVDNEGFIYVTDKCVDGMISVYKPDYTFHKDIETNTNSQITKIAVTDKVIVVQCKGSDYLFFLNKTESHEIIKTLSWNVISEQFDDLNYKLNIINNYLIIITTGEIIRIDLKDYSFTRKYSTYNGQDLYPYHICPNEKIVISYPCNTYTYKLLDPRREKPKTINISRITDGKLKGNIKWVSVSKNDGRLILFYESDYHGFLYFIN